MSTVQTLSAPGQYGLNGYVAVDANGNAVFTWIRFNGSYWAVEARTRSASGTLSAVQTISDAGCCDVHPVKVAVSPTGKAVFVWMHFDGADYRIQARARAPAGGLGAIQTVSPAGQDAQNARVAVDPKQRRGGVGALRRDELRIQARRRSATGALSAVQTLSAAGQDAKFRAPLVSQSEGDAQLTVDANGAAVLTRQRSDGTLSRIEARRRSAAGGLSTVQTVSNAGRDAFDPEVGITPDGGAILTWRRFDGTVWRTQTRRRGVGGSLSAVQMLSNAGQSAYDPIVAIAANGNAVFGWSRSDGTHARIQTRAGP